jgi:hypothetical protein
MKILCWLFGHGFATIESRSFGHIFVTEYCPRCKTRLDCYQAPF